MKVIMTLLALIFCTQLHSRVYSEEAFERGLIYAAEHNGHSVYFNPLDIKKVGDKLWYSTSILNKVTYHRELRVVKISDPKSMAVSQISELKVYGYMDCKSGKATRHIVEYTPMIGSTIKKEIPAGERLDPILDAKMAKILCM